MKKRLRVKNLANYGHIYGYSVLFTYSRHVVHFTDRDIIQIRVAPKHQTVYNRFNFHKVIKKG